jgi:hypothetical protein
MEENKKTITHVFYFHQKCMYVKIVSFQELRLSEYRATQNRARRDIPRHDIVTRDLALSKYPYHKISEMNKFFTSLDRASMNLLIFK